MNTCEKNQPPYYDLKFAQQFLTSRPGATLDPKQMLENIRQLEFAKNRLSRFGVFILLDGFILAIVAYVISPHGKELTNWLFILGVLLMFMGPLITLVVTDLVFNPTGQERSFVDSLRDLKSETKVRAPDGTSKSVVFEDDWEITRVNVEKLLRDLGETIAFLSGHLGLANDLLKPLLQPLHDDAKRKFNRTYDAALIFGLVSTRKASYYPEK